MSNFSNIGFNISSQEEFQSLLEKAYDHSSTIKIPEGAYAVYSDDSGAELFIQLNSKNICIGANPHFKGKSRRTVCLTNAIERPESDLDGAFHCWAAPALLNNPESGQYPFVFDLPDFKTLGKIDFPKNFEIQLTAFAHELSHFSSEKEYYENQETETKFAVHSFIPSGLFSADDLASETSPQAFGIFSGTIKEFEKKQNTLSRQEYYWLLVDTLGGEIDIVADLRFFEVQPVENGIVSGQFWLSGRLINPPPRQEENPGGFFKRFFRN